MNNIRQQQNLQNFQKQFFSLKGFQQKKDKKKSKKKNLPKQGIQKKILTQIKKQNINLQLNKKIKLQSQQDLKNFRQFFRLSHHSNPILVDEKQKDKEFIIKIIYQNGNLCKPQKGWIGYYKYDTYLLDGTSVGYQMLEGRRFIYGRKQLQEGYQKAFASMSEGEKATLFITSDYTFKKQGNLPLIPIYSVLKIDVQMVKFRLMPLWQYSQSERINEIQNIFCQVRDKLNQIKSLPIQQHFQIKIQKQCQILIKRAQDLFKICNSNQAFQLSKNLKELSQQLYGKKEENIKQLREQVRQKISQSNKTFSNIHFNFNYQDQKQCFNILNYEKLQQYPLQNKIIYQDIKQWALNQNKIKNCQQKLQKGKFYMKRFQKRQNRKLTRSKNQQKTLRRQYRKLRRYKRQIVSDISDYQSLQQVSNDTSVDQQDLNQDQIQQRKRRKQTERQLKLNQILKNDFEQYNDDKIFNERNKYKRKNSSSDQSDNNNSSNVMTLLRKAILKKDTNNQQNTKNRNRNLQQKFEMRQFSQNILQSQDEQQYQLSKQQQYEIYNIK